MDRNFHLSAASRPVWVSEKSEKHQACKRPATRALCSVLPPCTCPATSHGSCISAQPVLPRPGVWAHTPSKGLGNGLCGHPALDDAKSEMTKTQAWSLNGQGRQHFHAGASATPGLCRRSGARRIQALPSCTPGSESDLRGGAETPLHRESSREAERPGPMVTEARVLPRTETQGRGSGTGHGLSRAWSIDCSPISSGPFLLG